MCLHVQADAVKQRATRDIPVYKVLREDNTSPVMNYPYEANTLMKPKHRQNLMKRDGWRTDTVWIGLHCFPTLEVARSAMDGRLLDSTGCKIVKAVIPRGATYFTGTVGWDMIDAMVASSLRTGDLSPI